MIAMGLISKWCLEKYWDHGKIVETSFFGIYVEQNTFQTILLNLLCFTLNLQWTHPGHDPLFKVGPFWQMSEEFELWWWFYAMERANFFQILQPSETQSVASRLNMFWGVDKENTTRYALSADVLDLHSKQTIRVVKGLKGPSFPHVKLLQQPLSFFELHFTVAYIEPIESICQNL